MQDARTIPFRSQARRVKKKEDCVRLRNNILWIGCLTAAAQACALTLGNPHGPVVLGAPLDVRITVTPDTDQTLASSCIEAHALFGDTPAKVRTDLQPPHTVRLRSLQAINEPLATLHLSAGCTGKVSRSYTLFADPPQMLAAAPSVSAAPSAISSSEPVAAPAPRRSPPKTATPKRPAVPKKAPPPPPAPSQTAPTPAASAEPAPDTAMKASAPALPDDTLQAQQANARPVLRMDTLFLFHDPAEAKTARGDTTIALEPGPGANLENEHLQQLEKQLADLQQQQKKDRAQILTLTNQLAATAAADAIPLWLYLLLAALTAALLVVAYLLYRLRIEQARAQDGWMQTVLRSTQIPPTPSAPPTAAVVPAPTAPPIQAGKAETPPPPEKTSEDVPATKANSFVLPQADNHLEDDKEGPPSAYLTVTSQDFLDTQEQAEFYASIGEYDEAIELLQTHIANDGNSSPLPYLKLLDFFYQLSRTEAFEQVRQDLEAAFNIASPSLAQYHEQGPGLLEGYPTLLTHIEALWPSDKVLPLLRGAIHYPAKTPDLPEPLPRLAPTAFHELLLLFGIAQTTQAATRGSLTDRTSTVAEACNRTSLPDGDAPLPPATAAAAQPDLADFASSMDATLPELPQAPSAEETAPATTATGDTLSASFDIDWPLPAENTAPQATTEEAPDTKFDLEGLDFDDFEFKPTPPSTPPDTKA